MSTERQSEWRLAYGSLDAPVVVEVRLPEALPVLNTIFPEDRAAAGDLPAGLVVERSGSDFELRQPGVGTWRDRDLWALLSRLELVIAGELVKNSGKRGIHAAGLVSPRGATLLSGPGGSGKSSLTAALALRGWPVLGDDVVLLGAGWVHPFRRLLKIEEPARTLLGLPEGKAALKVWHEASFYEPGTLGSEWAGPARVHAVVFPRRSAGSSPRLTPVNTAANLGRMLSGLVMVDRVEPEAFEEVASVVECARVFDLVYDETTLAADLLVAAFT